MATACAHPNDKLHWRTHHVITRQCRGDGEFGPKNVQSKGELICKACGERDLEGLGFSLGFLGPTVSINRPEGDSNDQAS